MMRFVLAVAALWISVSPSAAAEPASTASTRPSPEQVQRWREEAKAPHVEAHAGIVRVAMDDMKQDRAVAFALLPEALRDSLPWWLDSKPAADWSPEMRRYVLEQFRRIAKNARTEPDRARRLQTWLAEPDPLGGASIDFDIVAMYSMRHARHDHGFSFSPPDGSGYDLNLLNRLLQSLSVEQRRTLLDWPPLKMGEHKGGLRFADLTPEQRETALAFATDQSRPTMEQIATDPDAVVRLNIQLKVYIRRQKDGEEETYEADLAVEGDPPAMPEVSQIIPTENR